MKQKSWVLFLLFLIVFIQITDCQTLKIQKSYSISWTEPLIFTPSEDEKIELLFFENAISGSDFPYLPLFYQKLSVDNFYSDYEYTISNPVFKSLTTKEINLIPTNYHQTEISITISTQVEKKKNFLTFSFIPIIQKGEGSFDKLISFDLTITGKVKEQKSTKSYKSNSILKSGNWYRCSVTQNGIHKITYSDFVDMGINTSGLRSANIALFGNGGNMLPELNGTPRIDDLMENPILVYDGGDGSFDDGDYFIFYAQSPHSWEYNSSNQRFTHKTNIYSDVSYYYINVDAGIGEKKRIEVINNNNLSANKVVTDYTHYAFYEDDINNILESGQKWFGDVFDITTTRNYNLSLPGYKQTQARITVCGAVSPVTLSSSFSVSVNNSSIGSVNYYPRNSNSGYDADTISKDLYFIPNSSSLAISLTYSKPTSSAVGYLEWIELQANCNLTMHSAQFPFCNLSSVGEGNITQYNISNATFSTTVWDVTNPTAPYSLSGTLQGTTFSFKSTSDELHQYVAFNGTSFLPVTPIGAISNQDLHANSLVDMIIVAHPDFISYAQQLATYRRENNGLTVRVVTPQQIYNEFSSGSQDPTAIRDYVKMIYEKSEGNYPQYLLLYGRPTYDFRGRISGTQQFVPNYQTNNVLSKNDLRSNDDFFGLMDDTEGVNCASGLIDVAVGRIPCATTTQAATALQKSINYTKRVNLATGTHESKISNLADWRNIMAFLADDEDGSTHINTADMSAQLVENANSNINLDKIYCDAYVQVSSSGGQRYPDVNTAINNRMNRGALVFTYVGHGGKDGLAHERILETSDMTKFNNLFNQPLMITLTCDFGWYDRPTTSPAELIYFNANGGAVSLITTSRVAFTGNNHSYAMKLFGTLFERYNGHYKTMGDINRLTKNANGGVSNGTNMIYLIGDPSIQLAVPQYMVVTDSVNGIDSQIFSDTIGSFSKVNIKGRITDELGNTVTNFNGNVFSSVYDKKTNMVTLQNDPTTSDPFEFQTQKSIIFKGNSSVKNGYFEFSFIVPKDINYEYGAGKISYYARSNNSDASGSYTRLIIGGISNTVINDKEGPAIDLYLNDENFVNNGTTDPNPILLAKLQDEYGINTTGNGIGHDLTAILDEETESQINLNDYYEAVQDSFNSGTVRYPLSDLAIGKHSIKVRAWDILNNVSEQTLDFTVVSDAKLALDHVLNYPNPFTTNTSFYFEHNQIGETYQILVQIFTISGKLVKTIETTQYLEGNRSDPIDWNGRDDFGDKIGKGVYLYKLKIRNSSGESAEKIEKIVIL